MQLVEQTGSSQPPIDAVGDDWLEIAGQRWQRSVMLSPDTIAPWQPDELAEIGLEQLQPALQQQPEVLLLATGPRLCFPSAQVRQSLQSLGVGLEVMDHRAAARTYNLLISESRRTVAVFLIERAG